MKFSRNGLTVIAFLLAFSSSQAQIKLPFTDNDLRNNLQKVLADYPHQFSSLISDTLMDNVQTIEFASHLHFAGALDNSITQYKSSKPIYSWKAILLSSEEFEEAASKYRWLFNQLKVMTVTLDGGYSFTFSGDYDEADESRKFSSSILSLTPGALGMPRLKVEASLQFEFPEWKVSLLVYEKEREDSERGNIHESER
ncbi:MAG: hypothetical protein ACJ75B_15670 [Flavisolibacter sp.]